MRKSEAAKIADSQLQEWALKNRDPGVLPAVPVMLLSLLTGDKAGVSINFSKNLSLDQAAKVLQSALAQVEQRLIEVQAGSNGKSDVDGTT